MILLILNHPKNKSNKESQIMILKRSTILFFMTMARERERERVEEKSLHGEKEVEY